MTGSPQVTPIEETYSDLEIDIEESDVESREPSLTSIPIDDIEVFSTALPRTEKSPKQVQGEENWDLPDLPDLAPVSIPPLLFYNKCLGRQQSSEAVTKYNYDEEELLYSDYSEPDSNC